MTLLFTLLIGCGSPTHLQYDFGRSYFQTTQMQADLSRASVVDSVYELSGTEAEKLRINVETATTEEKSGEAEVVE